MAYTTPPTFSAGDVASSTKFQILSDDISYVVTHVQSAVLWDNNADYTIASSTFALIDGTNLARTVTIVGTVAHVRFRGMLNITGANTAGFDIQVNGSRYTAFVNGMQGFLSPGVTVTFPLSFEGLITGLTPGSNTFKPMWMSAGSTTLKLFSGAGSAGTDWPVEFSVEAW